MNIIQKMKEAVLEGMHQQEEKNKEIMEKL